MEKSHVGIRIAHADVAEGVKHVMVAQDVVRSGQYEDEP